MYGNTHIWEMWDLGYYVHMSWHEHVQLRMQIYDEMANRGAMGATHI